MPEYKTLMNQVLKILSYIQVTVFDTTTVLS